MSTRNKDLKVVWLVGEDSFFTFANGPYAVLEDLGKEFRLYKIREGKFNTKLNYGSKVLKSNPTLKNTSMTYTLSDTEIDNLKHIYLWEV